jgi:two-component system LytT family response regulator
MDWNEVGFGRHPDRIVVKSGHKIEVIPLHDIFCLEAADDYVRIHAQQGIFLKKRTMGGYVAQMEGKQFVRVHRSWMIAMTALKRIDLHDPFGTMAILANGLKVPVSRQGYAKLKVLLDL